jgi:hypothetical protein
VKGELLKYVNDFKIINERLCWMRLKAEWFSCTLINVHVSTNEKLDETREDFYNLLLQSECHVASSDIKIILRDFNAKVGIENLYKPKLAMKVCIMNLMMME